jgi:hypothetical protein
MDTWVSIADEVAGDGRACVDLGWDSDDDGVIDACTFSGQAFRFESELVPGLNAAGLLAWRGVDGYTTYVFRRGALKLARWTVSTTIHTALNLHGEADVTLPETSIPLLWVPNVPIALIPVGITQVEVSMGLDSALRVEGAMEAGTSWGVVRSDTWRVDHVWREGEGLSVSGSHDVQTRPATDPRIEASAGGFVEAALDASVEVVATESWTRSSLEAGIGAEASLTLDVDPSAVPWWRVGVGTASFAEVELKLAEGLLGTFGVTEPLSSDAETVLEDAGTPFGAAGRDARWIDTVDFEAGSANTSGFSDVAALPGGGVIGIGSSALHAYATRLMPDGSFEWQKRWDFLGGDRSVDALDDGSIVAAFDNCERVFRLAGDGTILWDIAVEGEGTPAHCTVMAFTDPLGVPGILIANSRTIDTLSRPALTFLELDGTVRWSRTYTAAEGATAENGVVLADGHVVLVGGTDVDAHPPMAGYAAATGGGLMMEIDGWGEPLWGVSVNVARFEGVVEGATGDLLAIADVNTYIYQPRHGMGLVSVDRTGALRWATTYAEDVVFEGRADYPLDQTPGDTAWDEASDICALEGGDVLLLGTSSLSTNRAAWMLRTTSDGEPVWFRMHDGPAEDQPRALASLGAGAVAVGWSKSFPGGDSQKGWVARTPAEGGLRHDPAWGWSDRSLQPEVNDLEELVHVLYVDAGGAPVAFGFEDRTTTVDTSPPRPGVPSTPTAERVGF